MRRGSRVGSRWLLLALVFATPHATMHAAEDFKPAEVSVDGKKVGHTPTRKLELPEGKHKVVVKCVPPVCDNERAMKTQTVTIKADSLSEVRAE